MLILDIIVFFCVFYCFLYNLLSHFFFCKMLSATDSFENTISGTTPALQERAGKCLNERSISELEKRAKI